MNPLKRCIECGTEEWPAPGVCPKCSGPMKWVSSQHPPAGILTSKQKAIFQLRQGLELLQRDDFDIQNLPDDVRLALRRLKAEILLEEPCPKSPHKQHEDPDDSGQCIYCACLIDLTVLELDSYSVEDIASFVEHLRDDFLSSTEPVKKIARLIRERFYHVDSE